MRRNTESNRERERAKNPGKSINDWNQLSMMNKYILYTCIFSGLFNLRLSDKMKNKINGSFPIKRF